MPGATSNCCGASPQIGLPLPDEELVYSPATETQKKALAKMHRKGVILPLTFRAFMEVVEQVDRNGSHPTLNPMDDGRSRRPGGPILSTDPLELSDSFYLQLLFHESEGHISGNQEQVSWGGGQDAADKTWLGDEEPNSTYPRHVPGPSGG